MSDCGFNPACYVGDAAKSIAGDFVGSIAAAITRALGEVLKTLGTFWVKIPTPNLTTTSGGTSPSPEVAFIQGSLWWYMAAAAVLAVIIGGARMAWEQRAEPGLELLKALFTLTVVSGAGLTGIALAVRASDGFSQWIIDNALPPGSDFGQNVASLLALGATTGGGVVVPMLIIILGLFAILAAVAQIMLMLVRGAMLVVLAGIFPLSASFTNTEIGRAWFKKTCTWLIAFILYKPAAAIIYATAFRLASNDAFAGDGDALVKFLLGLMLMVLALVALPALMRFATPMVSSASGGGGGGAAAAAAAAVPIGALRIGAGSGPGTMPAGSAAGPSGGPSGSGNAGPGRAGGGSPPGSPAASGPSSPASPASGAGAAPAASSTGSAAAAGGPATGAAAGVAAGAAAVQGARSAGQAATGSAANPAADPGADPGGPRGSH